jgi:hypothetical protein
MDIETSNAIKLFFPNPSLIQVFFEALANSLDAGANDVAISIEIQSFTAPETLKITISDNGQGFTDDSFERFQRLLNPSDSFHKGLGRLVYLNYFGSIAVDSVWDTTQRTFVFSENWRGSSKVEKLPTKQPNSTTLVFSNFIRDRVKAYDDLKPGGLKKRIVEQFLPTLLQRRRNGVDLKVTIDLQTEESNTQREFYSSAETITLADLPELTSVSIKDPLLDIYDGIEMFYQVKSGPGERTVLIAANIDGRTIPINILQPSSVPFNNSVVFLFFSKLFEGKADTSRQKLELPDTISEPNLLRLLRREVGNVLAEKVPCISEKNTKTKQQFERCFPHLLGYFEETTVGIIDKDEALDIAQRKFFKAQKEILLCDKLNDSDFDKSLELSSRTLTEYILYRDLMIRKMKEMSKNNSEAEIHNLIVPRYNEFKKVNLVDGIYRNNAWLLDDKFMSFQTILSEARMDEVIKAITINEDVVDNGRPDIAMIFSGDPSTIQVDVVVVEIKKKTDDEKENMFSINQLLDRAQKLVNHCPNIQRVWYYSVIQINETLAGRLRQMKWAPLFSTGKVFYQDFETRRPDGAIVPTPTFVLSFDAIVGDAESRNHTFLQILKSGMKALADAEASKTDLLGDPQSSDTPAQQSNEPNQSQP